MKGNRLFYIGNQYHMGMSYRLYFHSETREVRRISDKNMLVYPPKEAWEESEIVLSGASHLTLDLGEDEFTSSFNKE